MAVAADGSYDFDACVYKFATREVNIIDLDRETEPALFPVKKS
jgi:hypothetical protein